MEHRHNWQEAISKEAQERMTKKLELLEKLDVIRADLRTCGRDFTKRDALSLQYRETVAKIATL